MLSVQFDPVVLGRNTERVGNGHIDLLILAQSAVVSSPAGNGSRYSAVDPSQEGSAESQRRNDASDLPERVIPVERMEALREK